jgi:DHA3 family macrolide efflux protein-like MFS transporter
MSEPSVEVTKNNWKTPFFILWSGQALSLLGSQLVQFALIWYLTRETGSARVLTMATIAAMLPQIILGPIAGTIVDRANRRRLMIAADASIALATLALAGLFAAGMIQIWHIYVLVIIRSLGSAFHGPAFTASTSLIVPKDQLARVQGLNQTLQGGLAIFSAPLGALLLELLPMQGILAIDVGTAMIAILPLLFIAIPQPERKLVEGEAKPTLWQDMRAGFAYVTSWRGLMFVLVMATLINFLLNPASALTPLLITEHFQGGALQLGWFEAIFGVGVILGGVALGVWGGFKKRIVTVMVGLIGLGLGMAGIGVAPANGFVIALASIFVAGVMQPIVNGSLGAVMQATVDPEMQGRVFTLLFSMATAISPLGLLIAGPLADTLGIQTWYVVGGLVCALMGVVGFFLPDVMSLEAGRPDKVAKAAIAAATE